MTDEPVGDLDPGRVEAALGARAVRTYPALLSTEPVAMAWARGGAPSGAVVVAEYQASPRGRAGLPWTAHLGRGLGFTLVHRDPGLTVEREGWPYVPALLALHDVVGTAQSTVSWPDVVCDGAGTALARLGVYVELGPNRTEWTTITVLIDGVVPPRAPLLADVVATIDDRLTQSPASVLDDYRPRCATLGRSWRARMLPLGPDGPEVRGQAVDVLPDGSLVLLTERGRRVAVPPYNLGLLEEPPGPVEPPTRLLGRDRWDAGRS